MALWHTEKSTTHTIYGIDLHNKFLLEVIKIFIIFIIYLYLYSWLCVVVYTYIFSYIIVIIFPLFIIGNRFISAFKMVLL